MLHLYVPANTGNPLGQRPPSMQYYVPNTYAVPTTGRGPFLLQPGVTGGPMASGHMGYLGQTDILGVSVDPTLLALGIGALLLAVYLFGGKRPQRKRRRLRSKIARAQTRLRQLEAEQAA